MPETLVTGVLEYAHQLDARALKLRSPEGVYRTAADVSPNVPVNVAAVPHRSPFRYPGGKTWLVPDTRTWLSSLNPRPKILIEPFAGGGIVGLTAGIEQLADHVVLVEKDADVAAVWRTIFGGQAEWLARRIERFDLVKKNVLATLETSPTSQRERAFGTILRNRVQRGGIMAPGAGLIKNGENGRGLQSRWYPQTLAARIRAVAAMRHRFTFVESDGLDIIECYSDDDSAAFFVDPPYTIAARRLYAHWQIDHHRLFAAARQVRGSVLLTYDNTPEILSLASQYGFATRNIAMKNTHHAQMAELIVS
ncbi:MAG: hypothetical protein ACRD8U_23015, partial [Pyrinomonadaceae bacterium]